MELELPTWKVLYLESFDAFMATAVSGLCDDGIYEGAGHHQKFYRDTFSSFFTNRTNSW